MGIAFAKTPKGHDEITTKAGGLSPRVRRVLIFVDGKRTVDELRGMLQSDDLQHTLGMLEEEGYIEVAAVLDEKGRASIPDAPLPSITAFRSLPDKTNPKELDMAKNYMMNSLKAFVGPYSHLTIVEAVFAATSHEALREQFAPWFAAIIETTQGKRRAEHLRAELLKVI
ncbi:MAG: hypothetical protein FD131_2860 [Rhodocyclaceae bacterium]|nr:MAG: hypothetical protein FD131_2860 [Rhodocyclaceae bacterium]